MLQVKSITPSEDGRLRPGFFPRSQATGRTSTKKPSPFGWAKWSRSGMMADPGLILCYADYSQQEFLLQGVLSGDENMLSDYAGGDVYVSAARRFGLMPPDGTKQSHPGARKIAKGLLLGLAYGMGHQSLALRIGCSESEARRYIRMHKNNYAKYWEFVDRVKSTSSLSCCYISQLGWIRRYKTDFNHRSAQNFPIQAAGADCLTLATIALHNAGYNILATVHDAFLLSLESADQAEKVKKIMSDSILSITDGHRIRVDAELFDGHYIDSGAIDELREVLQLIDRPDAIPEAW